MRERIDRPSVFDAANAVILSLLSVCCVLPLLHVLALSLSGEHAILSGLVGLFPREGHGEAYRAVVERTGMVRALAFTAYLTVLGTAVNVALTALAAYPLAKRDLVGKRILWLFILFTMFFGGGLIPLFLVVRSLGLLDTVWALILPGAIGTFNLILMKTYFQGIPESLAESARMDGCSELTVLARIIVPVSTPVLATLALFYGVGHWNDYFQALVFISDPDKYTLQLRLQQLIADVSVLEDFGAAGAGETPAQSLKAAAIVFATVPILLVFPFLQKYFAKGALLGSLKE
jgi:putative aldouronate transport system permease protein